MKEYQNKKPVVVIGGTAQDFLGEYMAGGILILLGLNLRKKKHHKTKFVGTGMHGGVIYLRGNIENAAMENYFYEHCFPPLIENKFEKLEAKLHTPIYKKIINFIQYHQLKKLY